MPKLIDTHTHLNFQAFNTDREHVIERTLENGVWMVNVGTQFETSRLAVELSEQYSDGVYASVGLHPIHLFEHHVDEEGDSFTAHGEEFNIDSYKELALRTTKVVAIGEFGLDYYRIPPNREVSMVKTVQKEVMKQHLILAKELDKPIIVHCRDNLRNEQGGMGAYEDLLAILKAHFSGPAVIHSFSGSWEVAKDFLDQGYFLGLNGIVTFDKSDRSEKVIKHAPLQQLLLETDAPYLAPVPYRGQRNEPLYIRHVAEKIAEIKGLKMEEVCEATSENARIFLNLTSSADLNLK